MSSPLRVWLLLITSVMCLPVHAADWNQWRGSQRNGVYDGPPLIDRLPAEGLAPAWLVEKLPGGGWACPVVAEGRVYLFAHVNSSRPGVKLPPEKYPSLKDDARAKLSKEELDAYEKERHIEQRARRKVSTRSDEIVHCFEAATGKPLWKNVHETVATNFPQSGTPAVVGGKLYRLGADRAARCIDAATGDDLWKTPLPVEASEEAIASSVAVADGVVVVLADHLFGLDAASGKIRWEGDSAETKGNDTSPVIWKCQGKSYVLANVCDRETVCLDVRDGRELWRVRGEASRSSPIVVGDRLITFGSSRGKGVRCFEMTLTGAEQLWACQKLGDPGASPVATEKHVFAAGDKKLACISIADGELVWEQPLGGNDPRYTSPAAGPGGVFYTYEHVQLLADDAGQCRVRFDGLIDETGRLLELAQLRRVLKLDEVEKGPEGQRKSEEVLRKATGKHEPLECCSPALADGRLYLRLKHGLVCYDLRKQP